MNSDNLNELFTALSKSQAEMETAQLNRQNSFLKTRYSDLLSIVKSTRPALTKYGLCVTQIIELDGDGSSILSTRLGHSSGQWIESRMKISPQKTDIQSWAAFVSYARRYCYAALICSVDGDDEESSFAEASADRDNEIGMAVSEARVTPEQVEELQYELKDHPGLAEEILHRLGLKRLADLPKSKYLVSLKRIREIKSAQQK